MAFKILIVCYISAFLIQDICSHHVHLGGGNMGGGIAGAGGRYTVGSGFTGAGSGLSGGIVGVGLTGIGGGYTGGVIGSGISGGAVAGGFTGVGGGLAGNMGGGNMGNNLLNNYGNGINDFILGNGEDISFGGTFGVSSLSSYSPSGLSLVSDNVLEGPVTVSGQLPFLGTIALGGSVPSGGFAGVSYGSGYSDVGIMQQVGAGVCPCN